MKTGAHPMKVKLKLFFEWGISFDENNPYTVEENANRKVEYADKQQLIDAITRKYHPEWLEDELEVGSRKGGGGISDMTQTQSQMNEPQHSPVKGDRNKPASSLRTVRVNPDGIP